MKLRYKIIIIVVVLLLLTPLWVRLWFQTRPRWVTPPAERVDWSVNLNSCQIEAPGDNSQHYHLVNLEHKLVEMWGGEHPHETDELEFDRLWDDFGRGALTFNNDVWKAHISLNSSLPKIVDEIVNQPVKGMKLIKTPNDNIGYLNDVKTAMNYIGHLASHEASVGNFDQVSKLIRQPMQLSEIIVTQGTFYNYAIYMAGYFRSLSEIRKWALDENLIVPEELWSDLVQELVRRDKSLVRSEEIIKAQFNAFLDYISHDDISRFPPELKQYLDSRWKKEFVFWLTCSGGNIHRDDVRAICGQLTLAASNFPNSPYTQKVSTLTDMPDPGENLAPWLKVKNPLGLYLNLETVFSNIELLSAPHRIRINIRATALIVGMRIYKSKHGKWPSNIDELAPWVPLPLLEDPLSAGGKFKLSHLSNGQWKIYSVGVDQNDDKGEGYPTAGMPTNIRVGYLPDQYGYDVVFPSDEFSRWQDSR